MIYRNNFYKEILLILIMNFIMTGHKGLIGSHLLERLKERGDKAVLLINKEDGKNIINIEDERLDECADVMIHLASFNKINKTIENPELAFRNIALGTFKVLEFCRENKIPKIVYTSSSRIIEKEKNPYTAAKIFGEELVKAYSQCYGIKYVIIRPSTVYGPRDTNTPRVIPIFIQNALQDKELKIYGDENKTLDFTYVDDFISGFLIAIEQNNKEYDFGTGKSVRLVDVADLIIKNIGKGRKVFERAEIAQPQNVELDISEMQKLGYNPKVSIEEGIAKTIDWFKREFDYNNI